MALSTPTKPKNVANRERTPMIEQTPKSAPGPMRRHKTSKELEDTTTPKRYLGSQSNLTAQTPKCYSKVIIETPVMGKSRNSRERCDEASRLTVAVRIRPMNTRELSYVGSLNVIKIEDNRLMVPSSIFGTSSLNTNHFFEYDHIFWSCDSKSDTFASQQVVFDKLGEPLIDIAFKGYNACLFAYGQTGSGKSYSMMGDSINVNETAGIIPRFCKRLFSKTKELDNKIVNFEVSYFEIYNEKIYDLLLVNPNNTEKIALKVREHPEWGPYIVNLSVHPVHTYDDLQKWLNMGNRNRATAATTMNNKSSRSHSIFSIEISILDGDEGETSTRSKVSLIDLAGSERIGNSSNNDEKTRQGVYINKSLLTLGKVISALSDQKSQFVPYRESVLTWLLRESLGGNSLTSMLATISPANTQIEETLATLRYACQARSIVNRVRINENSHEKVIKELQAEVERLRTLRQEYERHVKSSVICIDELEDLQHKLHEAEEKRDAAVSYWERRFTETTKWQQEELAKAERAKEELQSRLRVMERCDVDVKMSPYRTNFLDELEELLEDDGGQRGTPKKRMTRSEIMSRMSQIFELLDSLSSTVNESEENVKLLFAKANKSLQALETILIKSLKDTNSKTVTFNI